MSAILEHVNKGLIEAKQIVVLGEFWKPVLSCLQNEPVFSKKLKSDCEISCCAELVTFVNTTDECVEKILNSK